MLKRRTRITAKVFGILMLVSLIGALGTRGDGALGKAVLVALSALV